MINHVDLVEYTRNEALHGIIIDQSEICEEGQNGNEGGWEEVKMGIGNWG